MQKSGGWNKRDEFEEQKKAQHSQCLVSGGKGVREGFRSEAAGEGGNQF